MSYLGRCFRNQMLVTLPDRHSITTTNIVRRIGFGIQEKMSRKVSRLFVSPGCFRP